MIDDDLSESNSDGQREDAGDDIDPAARAPAEEEEEGPAAE
jgi:hypothetical protein